MSEENANPSTQQRELSDERGRVEWIDSALFGDIAENKRNPLKKWLLYTETGDFGSRATHLRMLNSLIQAALLRPLLYFLSVGCSNKPQQFISTPAWQFRL